MHLHFLDPYHDRSSWLHRLDARVKFTLSLGLIFTVALLPPAAWPLYALLLLLLLSAESISGLGVRFFLTRALLALPFVFAAVPLVFSGPPPEIVVEWFAWPISISQPGAIRFLGIAIRSWMSLQAALLLAATTKFPDLLFAMRALHFPRLLVAIVGLMWRYLFVLVDEAYRLNRARAARSGSAEMLGARLGGSLSWRARVTGGMVANLLLRSFDRADRIYLAMLSRGYDGEVRSLPHPQLSAWDWLVMLGGFSVYILFLLLSTVYAGG